MTGGGSTTFWSSIAKLCRMVVPGHGRAILLLVLLTAVSAVVEVVAIGSVVPFLTLLAGENGLQHLRWLAPFLDSIGLNSHRDQLLATVGLLCAAAIGAGALRIVLAWKTQDFVYLFGHRLSVEIQRRMLLQPYSWHVRQNSSEQLATLEKVELVTSSVLLPLTQALAAAVLILCVSLLLLQVAPLTTVAAGAILGLSYYMIGAFARRRLGQFSGRMDTAFEDRIRTLQEGLGGIREIILDGSQSRILDQFRSIDFRLARARASAALIATVPRFLIEPVGIVIIAGLALMLSDRPGGVVAALPALGALALGAQRLLPLVQQLFRGWSMVAANRFAIDDVVRRLRLTIPATAESGERLPFNRSIEFRNVSFTYADRAHAAVAGLSFEVRRGARLALVGRTGSGKSTTADLLMGLLDPSEGSILVDGVELNEGNRQAWRANVAHVPQMLFLADASIAQNIALSAEVDMDRVRGAASLAQLDDFIGSLAQGYETRVGERGAQISGGQRQRLAIARAIYKDTPLLVLDEATSALDDATETAVLAALDGLQDQGRTIVIIAHRSTTTERCDQVLRLENGRIAELAGRA